MSGLLGCGSDDSSEAPSEETMSSSPDQGIDPAPDAMATPPVETPGCAEQRFDDTIPATLTGDTETGDDTLGPAPCVQDGTSGSNDFVAFFVAPQTGRFRFGTEGSSFDTVMYARKGGLRRRHHRLQ